MEIEGCVSEFVESYELFSKKKKYEEGGGVAEEFRLGWHDEVK